MHRSPRLLTAALLLALTGAAGAQGDLSPAQRVEIRPGLSPEEAVALLDSMAPTNAGPVYYQLFTHLTPALESAHNYYTGGDGAVSDEEIAEQIGITAEQAAEELVNAQPLIENFIWASGLDQCDFGIMYQEGWAVLLPHLGKMRAATRVLRADAWRQLDSGDADACAERLAAILNMSRHVSRDRVLISSLVSIAMATHAQELIDHAVAEGELTEQGRDALIAALGRFAPDDPFNTRECIKMEGAITIGWLAKEYGDKPDAGARFVDADIAPDLSPGTEGYIRRLDGPALVNEARKLTPYYQQSLEAWDQAEADAKLEALGAMVEAGAYGEIAKVFAPALGKAYSADAKARVRLSETLDALRAYRAPAAKAAESAAPAD